MRIRGLDEDTGTASEDLKEMSGTIKGLTGVSLFTDDTNQTYKSTYQILQEISKVYDSLSDKDQAQVLELIAGKRQGNIVSSILENFKSAEDAIKVQSDATGGALREQATYMDSIVAHANTFKETFVGISQQIMDSDFLKGVIDTGTGVLGAVSWLIEKLGTLPTLASVAMGALSGFKNAGFFQTTTDESGNISGVSTASKIKKQAQEALSAQYTKNVDGLNKYESALIKISKEQLSAEEGQVLLNKALVNCDQAGVKAASTIELGGKTAKMASIELKGAAVATETMTFATKAATAAWKALSIAGSMLVGFAIVEILSIAASKIDDLVHADERAIESAQELSSKYQETTKSISDNITTVSGLQSEFETLSKGVSDNGDNISLSADEYKRYQEIVSQIVGISPSLIQGYDDEGNAIANKNGLIEKSIELLKEQQKVELLKQTTPENNETIAEGAKNTYTDVASDVETQKQAFLDKFKEVTSSIEKSPEMYDAFTKAFDMSDFWSGNTDSLIEHVKNSFGEMSKYADASKISDINNALNLYIESTKKADTASQGFSSQLSLIAQSTDGYDKLDSDMKTFVDSYTKSFKITEDTDPTTMMNDWSNSVKNFVIKLADAPQDVKDSVSKIKNLIANQDVIPANEWKKQVDDAVADISNFTGEDAEDIKVALGIEFNVDDAFDEIEKEFSDNSGLINKIESLTPEDLKLVIGYDIKNIDGSMTAEEFDAWLAKLKGQSQIDSAMQGLGSSMSSLQENINKASNASSDYGLITDAVNGKIKLTDQQVTSLTNTYPDLIKYLTYSTNGWTAESGAMGVVSDTLGTLQSSYVNAQNAMNVAVVNGVETRLSDLGLEITGIQNIISAYNSLSASKQASYEKVKSTYASAGLQLDNWAQDSSSYYGTINGVTIDSDTESMMKQIADAQTQLNTAKSQMNTLSKQVSSGSSSGSGSGSSSSGSGSGSSSSATDTWKEAAENEYATAKYRYSTQLDTVQQYYDKISAIEKKYYAGKSKYIDEDRDLLTELFNTQQTIEQNWFDAQNDKVETLSQSSGTEKQQISVLQGVLTKAHSLADKARARGLSDTSDYIQNLKDQYGTASDQISDLYTQIFDTGISDKGYIIDIDESEIGNTSDVNAQKQYYNEQMSLYKKMAVETQAEINRLQDQGVDKNKERIQELTKQLKEYESNAIEIYKNLNELQIDSLEDTKASYEDRQSTLDKARSAVNEYIESEVEALELEKKMLEDASSALDDAKELQDLQNDLLNANKAGTRIFTEGKGWVWSTDQDAIDDAQDALSDYYTEKKIENIEKQIDSWNEYSDKWEDTVDAYEKEQNNLAAVQEWGSDWQEQIWDDMNDNLDNSVEDAIGLLGDYRDEYKSLLEDIADVSKEISELEDLSIDELTSKYGTTETTTGTAANTKINGIYNASASDNNASATLSDGTVVGVTVTNGKTQTIGLPIGTTVHTNGGDYEITGGTGGNYTSTKVSSNSGSSGSSGNSGSGSGSTSNASSTSSVAKAVSATVSSIKKALGFSGGGVIADTGLTMVHGEKGKSEVAFNSGDAKKLFDIINGSASSEIIQNMIGNNFKQLSLSGIVTPTSTSNDNSQTINIESLTVKSDNATQLINQLSLMSKNR